jgi:hypothetical protein
LKVLCGEGVANHTAPESCAATREGRSEALTGDSAGKSLSGENQLRGADAFRLAEGDTAHVAIARHGSAPRRRRHWHALIIHVSPCQPRCSIFWTATAMPALILSALKRGGSAGSEKSTVSGFWPTNRIRVIRVSTTGLCVGIRARAHRRHRSGAFDIAEHRCPYSLWRLHRRSSMGRGLLSGVSMRGRSTRLLGMKDPLPAERFSGADVRPFWRIPPHTGTDQEGSI